MEQDERRRQDRALERVEAHLAIPLRTTAPVLQATASGHLVFVGSAVLLDAGEHAFVLTASHVLDHESSGELLLGRIGSAVSLRGPRALTRIPPGGSREDDHVDLAMVHLTDTARASFLPEEFINLSQLHSGPPVDGDFILAGYPISQQPKRLIPGDDSVRLYGLLAGEEESPTYVKDRYDRENSLLLRFKKEDTWRKGVGRAVAPDLYGVSGCGIWHLKDLTAASKPRLCAIAIEWHRGNAKRILGTRIRVALEELARRFPEIDFGLNRTSSE
jgi:hypothetical protein